MLTIKVLGSGCANCKRVEQIAQKVISEMALEAEIIKVTDYKDIMAYNVMSTPGLVINEKLVSYGRIPTPAEVTTWLVNALEGKSDSSVNLNVLTKP
jgi:small redox-active disulfide protein 2